MKKSRLKNIVNISKSISNKSIGEFDSFKDSLPNQVGDSYRLEAAWKAYGKPKDFKEAVWYGMIQPTGDQEFRLPSIGYNEETDEYEYLNKGKDNETVNKDIRVWDNDVIPFVKELKNGGYIRTFNEEKDCWTYTKNKPQETQNEQREVIEQFQQGGKPSKKKDWNSYYEFLETLPKNLQKGNDTDTSEGYRMKLLFDNTPNLWTFEDGLKGENPIFTKEEDGYHAPSVIQLPDGHYEFLKSYNHPTFQKEIEWYNSDDGKSFREKYILRSKDDQGVPLVYYQYIPKNPQAFKQGGAVIPSGSLHAHKNHMQLASEGLVTSKGIPVISEENGKIQQQAEIEREEVIFDKQATTDIESLYKKFNETDKESEKNEIAIKAGKILTDIFIKNTDDRTGLIEKVAEKNNLEYSK